MLRGWVTSWTLLLIFVLPFHALGEAEASEKFSEDVCKTFGVQKFSKPVKAPPFTMINFQGQEIKSSDLLGKVVWLTFFTTD